MTSKDWVLGIIFCAALGLLLIRIFPFPLQFAPVSAFVWGERAVDLPGIGSVSWEESIIGGSDSDASFALRAAQACGEQCLYRCKSDDKWYLIGRIGERFFTVVGYGARGATAYISGDDPTRRVLQEGCESVRARWAGHDGFTPGLGY